MFLFPPLPLLPCAAGFAGFAGGGGGGGAGGAACSCTSFTGGAGGAGGTGGTIGGGAGKLALLFGAGITRVKYSALLILTNRLACAGVAKNVELGKLIPQRFSALSSTWLLLAMIDLPKREEKSPPIKGGYFLGQLTNQLDPIEHPQAMQPQEDDVFSS